MTKTELKKLFSDVASYTSAPVTVCGWVKTIRVSKSLGFIELNDGTCFKNLQVVMSADELNNYKEIAGQNVGAALIVRGAVVLTPEAKQFIIDAAYDPQYGARPLRRYLQHTVETLLARRIVEGNVSPGATLRVEVRDDALQVV